MAVPEAAVSENYRPMLREHQIGLPGQVSSMKLKTETEPVEPASEHDFRFGVLSPDSRHHPAADSR